MLYARLVNSPYAHARIVNIDTSAVLSIPGVVAAFTAETLGIAQVDLLSRAQSPLAQHEVVWCGHPLPRGADQQAWYRLCWLLGTSIPKKSANDGSTGSFSLQFMQMTKRGILRV
jgi:hypothetical protein